MNIQNVLNNPSDENAAVTWAARLELRSHLDSPEYADGYVGGFVTVVARCASALEFISMATQHLREEGFDILAVEDLAPLAEGRFELNQLMQELEHKTRSYPLQWSTFDLYRDSTDSSNLKGT